MQRTERFLDAEKSKEAEARFVDLLDEAYRLSTRAIAGDREAQEEFDRAFKPI